MRMIDADALEKRCFKMYGYGDAKFLALGNIRTAPTIEAEPVKHGYWIEVTKNMTWKCSECGELSCCKSNFCHNCGAKMQGGKDE